MVSALLLPLVLAGPSAGKGIDMMNAWNAKLAKAKTLSGTLHITSVREGRRYTTTTHFTYKKPNLYRLDHFADGKPTGFSVCDGEKARKYNSADKTVQEQNALPNFNFYMGPVIGEFTGYGEDTYLPVSGSAKPSKWHGKEAYEVLVRQTRPTRAKEKEPVHRYYFDAKSGFPVGDHKKYPGVAREFIMVYENLKVDQPVPASKFKWVEPKGTANITAADPAAGLIRVGGKVPAVKGKDQNGVPVDLNQELKKHKLLILDFWYVACAPCRKSLPELVALQKQLKDQGVGLLTINNLDLSSEIKKFFKDGGYTARSILSETVSQKELGKFGVRAWPTTYIIDTNGVVRGAHVGSELEGLKEQLTKLGIQDVR